MGSTSVKNNIYCLTAMEEEYKVIKQIGKGSFGRVLLVETGETRDKFVIKQVNTANMAQNETEKVRMKRKQWKNEKMEIMFRF